MATITTMATTMTTVGPMPSGLQQNLLYATYKDAGPSATLISTAAVLNAAGLPGLLGNAFLCLVTIRNRSLRSSSNQLLAFTALFELFHQSAHFSFLAVAVTGINFIPYQLSVYLQLHSIFGVSAAQMAMLVTAVDRLIAVSAPVLHGRVCGKSYLAGLLALCSLTGLYFVILALHTAGTHWDLPVTGSIGDLFIDEMAQLFMYLLVAGILNILTYVLIWVVVRAKTSNASTSADRNARLFRSLVGIICVVLGGYLLNNLVRLFFLNMFQLDHIQMWLVGTYAGVILNVGASAEVPILYMFSTDYRKVFTHEVKRMLGKASGNVWTTQAQTKAREEQQRISQRIHPSLTFQVNDIG